MTEPIVVTISHRLGRAEAKRRLDASLGRIRGQLAPFSSSIDYSWSGDRLEFSLVAMRQSIAGSIEIDDALVTVVLRLPLLLRLLATPIIGRVRSEATRLLDKPEG